MTSLSSAEISRQNRMYQIGPMLTSSSVYWAFGNRSYVSDPEYVKAVIRNYVYFKAQKGKSKSELSYKLEILERDFAQFGYAFRAIRQEYGLGPSRVLPQPQSSNPNNNLRRTQTASTPSRTATVRNNNITRTHTTVGATTVRPAQPQNDDDLPPPPYASQDPEPAATLQLQERLAAEAEARGNLPQITSPLTTSSTTSTHYNTASSPATSPNRRPLNTGSTGVQEELQRIPSDPELARAWEESQLEEATRASLAHQVEQQELQEAMRLSMAEAEAQGACSSSSHYEGSSSTQNHPISTIPEDRSDEGPGHNAEMRHLVSGMEDMIIPGSYNSAVSTSTTGPISTTSDHPIPNILDEPVSNYSHQPPLSPQRTGLHIQSKNPFLSSNEKEQLRALEEAALTTPTSEHFRSPSTSFPGSSHTQYIAPTSPPLQTHRQSFSSFVESAAPHAENVPTQRTPPPIPSREGSSYTHYTPPTNQHAVSSESSQQLYTPPSGPPPSHLRIVTPISPSTRPLPATPSDQTTRDEVSSPRIAFPQPIIGTSAQPYPSLSSPSGTLDSHNSLHQTLQSTPPSLPLRRKSTFIPLAGKEDALEMLRDYDTVLLVDDSTSMAGQRWSEARQALMEVSEIAARYDENGVDIYFLNSKRVGKGIRAAHEVEDLFRGLEPKGATPTGMRLESILREYMARLERSQLPSSPSINGKTEGIIKPMNLIVVTDGVFAHPVLLRKRTMASDPTIDRNESLQKAPTDDPESVLIACAKRLDRGEFPLYQVGIQFLQIGNDSEAREALQELDDGLVAAHGVRDIVDTVPYDGEEMSAGLIIKTLLGGINRRLDRRDSA